MQIIIQGGSSGKLQYISYTKKELSETLLQWLSKHHFPIASSCSGEGVCKKCTVLDREQSSLLSCQITLAELQQNQACKTKKNLESEITIKVDYL